MGRDQSCIFSEPSDWIVDDEQFDASFCHSCCGSGSGSAPFFCGSASYTLQASHIAMDAIQAECPVRLTKDPGAWGPLARALLGSLEELWRTHLQQELCSGGA